jgi:hypothetical protein
MLAGFYRRSLDDEAGGAFAFGIAWVEAFQRDADRSSFGYDGHGDIVFVRNRDAQVRGERASHGRASGVVKRQRDFGWEDRPSAMRP